MVGGKPSIYDNYEPTYVVVKEPDQLELKIRETRHSVTNYFSQLQNPFAGMTDKFFDFERDLYRAFDKTVREPILPNALYVMLAMFAGGIMTRQRGIISRTLVPTILATGTGVMLFPETTREGARFAYKSLNNNSTDYPAAIEDIPTQVSAVKAILPDFSSLF